MVYLDCSFLNHFQSQPSEIGNQTEHVRQLPSASRQGGSLLDKEKNMDTHEITMP